MDKISIRYGESVTLPLDADDATAVEATLYVGNPGQLPVLTKTIVLTDGTGVFELDINDTSIPLGSYKYQINVEDELGAVTKYPNPDDCNDCGGEDSFPEFVIYEALDLTEVS